MKKKLPKIPPAISLIGPGLIAIGTGLGSGEFILWPYLTAQFGLGIIWGAVLGIFIQLILITEISRYAIVTGKSIFDGFKKIHRLVPWILAIFTIVGFGWPGFAATTASLWSRIDGFNVNEALLASVILIFCGLLLTLGHTVYKNLENAQKYLLLGIFIFLAILTVYIVRANSIPALLKGAVGIGDGYKGIPKRLLESPNLAIITGAFAYSGSGGTLLLSQSFYALKRKFGKAGLNKDQKPSVNWLQKWIDAVFKEATITFFGLGLISIIVLALLSYSLVYKSIYLPDEGNLDFIYFMAEAISSNIAPWVKTVFLAVGGLILFTTQLGILDSVSRITSETIKISFKTKSGNIPKIVVAITVAVGLIIFWAGFKQPLGLITIGAVLNGLSMAVYTPMVLSLGTQLSPPTPMWKRIVLIIGTILYAGLFVITLASRIF